jgi:DHA1 family tetracycline resistance protein-like MFS transporter
LFHEPVAHFRGTCALAVVFSIIAFATAAILWRDRRFHAPPQARTQTKGNAKPSLKGVMPVLALIAITSFAYTVVLSTTALLVHRRFAWGSVETGWLLGLAAVIIAVTRATLMPWAIRKIGEIRLMIIAMAATAVGLVGFGLAAQPTLLIAAFVLVVCAGGTTLFVPTVLISKHAPVAVRGYALGISQSVGALATVASSSINGLLFQYVGPAAPHFAGAIILLLGLAAMTKTSLIVPAPKASSEQSSAS